MENHLIMLNPIKRAVRDSNIHHASGAPDIGRGTVRSTNQNLKAPVLTGLYIIRVVMKLNINTTPIRHIE